MVLLLQAHTLLSQNEELTALHSLSFVQAPSIPATKCRKLRNYCYFSHKSDFKERPFKTQWLLYVPRASNVKDGQVDLSENGLGQ